MKIREAKKAATKAKVLEAARELFRQRGFERATLRDVAKAVGMSTGAVFASFKDKADLYAQAMGKPAPDIRAFLTRLGSGETPLHVTPGLARELRQQLFGAEG